MQTLAFIPAHLAPFMVPVAIVFIILFFVTINTIIDRVYPKEKDAKKTKAQSIEEDQLIQQMHKTLNRLEERIESLETLMVDKEREKARNP